MWNRASDPKNIGPVKSNAMKGCLNNSGFCAAKSPTNAMCPPTSSSLMLRCAKWRVLIRRRKPSSVEFPALASKSCGILRNHLLLQSEIISRAILTSCLLVEKFLGAVSRGLLLGFAHEKSHSHPDHD